MSVGPVRAGVIVGVIVGVIGAIAVSRTPPSGPRHVTLTVAAPCGNPQPLILGDHAWWTTDAAPSDWGNGDERGTFTVIRTGEAVFRSDRDGKELVLHRSPSRFTMLTCVVGGSAPGPGVTAPIAGSAGA